MEILKQGQYMPMPVEKQIAIIYCGTMGLLKDVPVTKVKEFEKEYLEYLDLKHKDILNDLRDGILIDDMTKVLEKVAMELASKYEPQ